MDPGRDDFRHLSYRMGFREQFRCLRDVTLRHHERDSIHNFLGRIGPSLDNVCSLYTLRTSTRCGPLFPTFLVGFALQIIGIFATSVCRTLWQLVLAQDLCTGVHCGIVFGPALGIVTTCFKKSRGLAVASSTPGISQEAQSTH